MASTGETNTKKPRKPDEEDTNVAGSLLPPARSIRDSRRNLTDTRSSVNGDGNKKTKKPKSKKSVASTKGKLNKASQNTADVEAAPTESITNEASTEPRTVTASSATATRTVATVDDALYMARTDDTSVMTDDDYTCGTTGSVGTTGKKDPKVNGKASKEGTTTSYDQAGKQQTKKKGKKQVGRTSSSSGVNQNSESEAANKNKSNGRQEVNDNYQNMKQVEKERRAIAQSQISNQDDDTTTVAATPTSLARGSTALVSLPGAYHIQPSTQSGSSNMNDDTEGTISNYGPHDDVEEIAADITPSSSISTMSRISTIFRTGVASTPTTRSVDAQSSEDDVIDAETCVCSPSVEIPEEGMQTQISDRVSQTESSNRRIDDNEDVGDGVTVPIVAEIVPNDEEKEKRLEAEMREKVKREVDARLERERKSQIVAEAVHVDDSKLALIFGDGGRFSQRKKLPVIALVCLLIVIIAVIGGVVAGNSNSSHDAVTQAPTPTPTIITTAEFQSMVNAIGGIVSSDPSVFQNASTVQYAAMDWLANDDTYAQAVGLNSSDTRQLVERYAVAVFYFSTKGPSWRNQYNFLDPISVCEWASSTSAAGVSCSDGQFVSSIEMSDESLRGNLPSEVGLLSKLDTFDGSLNFISGTIPTEIFSLKNLTYLDFEGNALTGSLPTEIGLATQLTSLTFPSNRVQGKVPNELYKLTRLEVLDMHENTLTGTVSSLIGKLTLLTYIDTGSNQLTGFLPTEVGLLRDLEDFYMELNNLVGEIPSEFGLLDRLTTIWLSNNNFEGTVPVEFSTLTDLGNVQLHANELVGDLDNVFCTGDWYWERLWADCGGLLPKVTCICCSVCCNEEGDCVPN